MRDEIVHTLLEKVKKDYSSISLRFDQTRQHPWEEFAFFTPYVEKGHHILDCGCGNGRLSAFLRNKHVKYVGMDNNEDLLKLAQFRHPDATFVLADQTKLPFPDGTFDHVWNIAAFHHVPSKKLRAQTLSEMHRVLKPGGYLMLTVWNLWQKKYLKYVIKSIFQNLLFGEYEINDTFVPWGKEKLVLRYYHAFRMKELEMLLKKAGFTIIDSFCTKKDKKVSPQEAFNICFICKK